MTWVATRGQVGVDDPLLVLEDATREFGPDHLLIAARGADRAGWQERGLLDRVLERFAIPVNGLPVPGLVSGALTGAIS